jgi:diaminohydroxyphosphoribosylaminopyrimidine deaminase/5-amino-6-(5-phosphoribosylamino)uracil reductase
MTAAKKTQRSADEQQAVDREYLRRCLRLASRARGSTSPNPMVGALVVHGDQVVAQAYHHKAGTSHAEHLALATAGDAARGATLYTNMEPCCHHGHTPPCVEGIRAAGVRRVVVSMADPDPRVNSKGFAALRAEGIEVDVGELAEEAARLNEAYLTLKQEGRPFVLAKAALSLDGRLATRTRQSQWITGEVARQRAHRLRGVSDAVIVGVGTLLSDDPRLTARHGRPRGPRFRVVLDSHLRTPADCRLLTSPGGQVLIFTTDAAPPGHRKQLEAAGAEVLTVEASAQGRVAWEPVLADLARRGSMSALLEGGSDVLTSAFEADIIDKVFLIYAPLLIGGSAALPLWGGDGIDSLDAAPRLRHVRRSRLGEDWAVEGYIHSPRLTV